MTTEAATLAIATAIERLANAVDTMGTGTNVTPGPVEKISMEIDSGCGRIADSIQSVADSLDRIADAISELGERKE